MIPYDFDMDRAVDEARKRGAKRVLIQAPDGLKQYLDSLYLRLASEGIFTVISADPCYGACDLAEAAAGFVKPDLLIHIGHAKFQPAAERVPTVYLPARHFVEAASLYKKTAELLVSKGVRKVGLVSSVQHLEYLKEFGQALSSCGVRAIVDKESGGLVLGCRVDAARRIEGDVDAFVYLGGGDFHGLGVALAVDKEVYIADPYRDEVRDLAKLKRKVLAKKWWAIMEATKAASIGVVMVAKTGQFVEGASNLCRELEIRGRKAYLILMEEATWERMAPFTFIDAFIVTGCPRVALDNQESFIKPVLNLEDAQELLRRL
jgi:2-(3-amino-3-carboxypropyl)histidine synthase